MKLCEFERRRDGEKESEKKHGYMLHWRSFIHSFRFHRRYVNVGLVGAWLLVRGKIAEKFRLN